jgi:hypothetical protein
MSAKNVKMVYPNPTAGVFTVSSTGRFDYMIMDQQGKQVEKGKGENTRFRPNKTY